MVWRLTGMEYVLTRRKLILYELFFFNFTQELPNLFNFRLLLSIRY